MLAARRIVSSYSMGVRRTLATRIVHRRGGRDVSEYLISATSSSIEKAQAQDGSGSSSLDLATYTASYLLPKGYPATVGPDYMGYSMWCATAGACASAGGVLATQSLLCAVGIGSGGASSTLPLTASLNWVLGRHWAARCRGLRRGHFRSLRLGPEAVACGGRLRRGDGAMP